MKHSLTLLTALLLFPLSPLSAADAPPMPVHGVVSDDCYYGASYGSFNRKLAVAVLDLDGDRQSKAVLIDQIGNVPSNGDEQHEDARYHGMSVTSDGENSELKSASFDKDPNWKAINNRTPQASVIDVTQDFGYSATSFATQAKGVLSRPTFVIAYG